MSFAVGAILGDIFFHLLPESQESYRGELEDSYGGDSKQVGLSIIAGVLMFFLVELMLKQWSTSNLEVDEEATLVKGRKNQTDMLDGEKSCNQKLPLLINNIDLNQNCDDTFHSKKFEDNPLKGNNNNDLTTNLNLTKYYENISNRTLNNISSNTLSSKLDDNMDMRRRRDTLRDKSVDKHDQDKHRKVGESGGEFQHQANDVDGYLSLIANGLDNFNHGLAIGASFLAGTKVGLLTTFVIFIHEIPHEICDYAILVNSGFSRLEAVKAQSSVSLFTILGTATALYVKSVRALTAHTLWILPFSAGGFLYIALVNLLPEILDRGTDIKNSIIQIACVMLGIGFMVLVAFL